MRAAKRWSSGTLAGAGAFLFLSACASTPGPEPAGSLPTELNVGPPAADQASAPVKEPVASGKDCAPAEALCDGGLCKVTVKNGCEQPVTCDLAIVATCKSGVDMVEAKGRTRGTVAAKADGDVQVVANCTMGNVIRTEVEEFRCQ